MELKVNMDNSVRCVPRNYYSKKNMWMEFWKVVKRQKIPSFMLKKIGQEARWFYRGKKEEENFDVSSIWKVIILACNL